MRNLEDRNQALKDRIENLENMLKSSVTNTANLESIIDTQEEGFIVGSMALNSPTEHFQDYSQHKTEQLEYLNR